MVPSRSRQLLIWTIPTIAVIFSYFWYRRKRNGSKIDPGDTAFPAPVEPSETSISPTKKFTRSISGVESAPIDIIIPPKLRAAKSNPIVISDEDLDLEIEKIKSMKYGRSFDARKTTTTTTNSNNPREFTLKKLQSPLKKATPSPKKKMTTTTMVQKVDEEKALVDESPENVIVEESTTTGAEAVEVQRQNSERDSANHSPADVMLASPTLSSISDDQSEGSNDSGKGGSDVVTPPPSRVLVPESASAITVYEFLIPQNLVGKLIGKKGCSVTNIKDKTGAHVLVRKHPTNNGMKVCTVEGTQKEINSALALIRNKFPLKRFPEITLEAVSFCPQVSAVSLSPERVYLNLIEGINNDTIVSCIMAPNHLFLQQPTHPSFQNLNLLSGFMNACYVEDDSPMLPTPILENTICVALSGGNWYRVIVVSEDVDSGICYVKFLDYGGYAYIEESNLRQIRADFMMLPFQAAECFLANIKSINETGWSDEAYAAIADLTKGAIVFTQVVDHTVEHIPLVLCYLILGPTEVVFLNQELVRLGHAEWLGEQDEAAGVTVA